jgi:hypothetical protein
VGAGEYVSNVRVIRFLIISYPLHAISLIVAGLPITSSIDLALPVYGLFLLRFKSS